MTDTTATLEILDAQVARYDDDFERVAFVATSVNQPTELYVANVDGSEAEPRFA